MPEPSFFGQRPAIRASRQLDLGQQHVNYLSAPNGCQRSLARVGFQDHVPSQMKLNSNGLPQEPVTLHDQDLEARPGWRDVAQGSGFEHRFRHGYAESST